MCEWINMTLKTNNGLPIFLLDDHEHEGYRKMELLTIAETPDGLEQAALGYRQGSGGAPSFLIFGKHHGWWCTPQVVHEIP